MELETENEVNQPFSMDAAWEEKRFAKVLLLLQNDSNFPHKFNVEELNEEDDTQRNLKFFAEERNRLHEWIKNDQLGEVQQFTTKNQSKYFFNAKSKSAAFTALKNRKFKIYAHLQSIDVNLTNYEADEMDELTSEEKYELKDIMLSYFPTDEKAHIYNLMSKIKIKSPKTFEECKKELFGYLEKLNEISSVSIILKVMQYVENLDLVLDLTDKNVKTVCPPATTDERGKTFGYLNTIYVAAGGGRTEKEILGTLAHELTHMAMKLVFKNDTNRFSKSDHESKKEFEEKVLLEVWNIKKLENTPSQTLKNAFTNYPPKEYASELIARVPQILAQYDDGEDWLKNNVPKLLKFYEEKVIPECDTNIKENRNFSQIKRINRFMNENEGQITYIKKWGLFFQNVDNLKDFLKLPNKNVFLITTDYTRLGLIRALQATYGIDYAESYDNFLVFSLKNLLKNLGSVEYLFNSEVTKMLFIECPNDTSVDDKTLNKIKRIMKIVEEKNKKVIFVTGEGIKENIVQIIEECGLSEAYVSETDEDFFVSELMESSQRKILGGKILFQGRECSLDELINGNEDLLQFINPEKIQEILSGKKIKIGSKLFGSSSLEGAYADIFQETDLAALIHEINNSQDIFLISGKKTLNKKKLVEFFNKNVNDSLIVELKNFELEISGDKRVFLTNEVLTDDDFRSFCSFNSTKKIYHIKNKDAKFELLKLFNPDFYFKRRFKRYKKIVIKKKLLDAHNLDSIPDFFIIINDCNDHLRNNSESSKIKILRENVIQNSLKDFNKSEVSAHVLKWENCELIWIESRGSLSKLREWIDWYASEEEIVENENALVAKIRKERVVILADDPGMGKTTSITKLHETQQILSDHWVIRINLKDHIKAIQKLNDKLRVNEIITFLTEIDYKLRNYMIKRFLEAAIDPDKEFGKILLLCFDGFDELLNHQDRNRMLNLFGFLKSSTKCKIWITTRLHYKNTLENELSVFSVRFEPIDDLSKENFIVSFVKNRLKLTINHEKYDEVFKRKDEDQVDGKLENFTKHFLAKTNEIFQKDLERFIGTPLQLNLLLENSITSFRDTIENLVELDFSYLGKNLLEVYQNFFKRKYEIYCKKKNVLEEASLGITKDKFEKWHERLADSLFNNKAPEDKIRGKKPQLLLLGLIKDEAENIEFIHFTFREYFFLQHFIKNLIKCGDEKSSENICKFFMNEILVKEKYELIRKFINAYLENKEVRETLQEKNYKVFSNEHENNTSHVVAVREHNNNILEFLLTFYSSGFTSPDKIIFSSPESFLHLAVEMKNDFAVDKIIELASKYNLHEELLTTIRRNKITVFHFAVREKNNFAVKKIIELASKYNLNEQLLTAVDKDKDTALNLAVLNKNDFAFNQILELASKYNLVQKLITAGNVCEDTAFHLGVSNRNDFAVNQILKLSSKHNLHQPLLTAVNKYGNTAFHLAVWSKNEFAFNRILDLASKYNLDEQLLIAETKNEFTKHNLAVSNKKGWNKRRIYELASKYSLDPLLLTFIDARKYRAFYLAVWNKNDAALNLIIKLAYKHKLVQQLLTSFYIDGNTAFHLAVEQKNDFAVNRILELASKYNLQQKILISRGHSKNTGFHVAVEFNNNFAFERIIELASKYDLEQQLLTAENTIGYTAFHKAVKNKNDFAFNRIIDLALKYNLNEKLLTAVDSTKNTAFHLALIFRNQHAVNRIIELALNNNADHQLLTVVDTYGRTAFHIAVEYKSNFAINRIIELAIKNNLQGKLLTATTEKKETVFHLAVTEENDFALERITELASKYNLCEQLLTSVDEDECTVFHSAIYKKNDFAMNRIIELASQFNLHQQLLTFQGFNNNTAFHAAVLEKNDFAVNRIIELASKYNLHEQLLTAVAKQRNTAFHLAVKRKNDLAVNRIIELALKYNLGQQLLASVNENGETAFNIAVMKNNDFAVKRITELASKYNLDQRLLLAVNRSEDTAFE